VSEVVVNCRCLEFAFLEVSVSKFVLVKCTERLFYFTTKQQAIMTKTRFVDCFWVSSLFNVFTRKDGQKVLIYDCGQCLCILLENYDTMFHFNKEVRVA
jgi:hypothetical protein